MLDALKQSWANAPEPVKRAIRTFVKYPSERNSCFVSGYLCASAECGRLEQEDYHVLLAAVGQINNISEIAEVLK